MRGNALFNKKFASCIANKKKFMNTGRTKVSSWPTSVSSLYSVPTGHDAINKRTSRNTLATYSAVLIIAVLGAIFIMLQMVGIGLTLWVGVAIVPQWWATANSYHQMCDQIKDKESNDANAPDVAAATMVTARTTAVVLSATEVSARITRSI